MPELMCYVIFVYLKNSENISKFISLGNKFISCYKKVAFICVVCVHLLFLLFTLDDFPGQRFWPG